MAELTERQKRFLQAKKLHEQAEKEKSLGGFGKVDLPKFETLCLKRDKSSIVRLMGNSLEMHEKDSDPIMVSTSLIKDDKDKWFNLIWSDDAEHPMNKLRKVVIGKYKWNKENRTREYDNKGIPVFERFMTNGITGNPYNQGMQPQNYILMNCISRGENDTWCKDHKHTKLLCWDCMEKEVDGEMKVYPTYGIKKSLYSEIWDKKCVMRNRHFEDFDVLVRRLSKEHKMGDSYICVNLKEEKSAIENWERIDREKYLEYMDDEFLTPEEESYERYKLTDIPFISKPTPCGVILSHLGKYIKEVDAQFGTSLYSEFIEWKAKEIEESKKENAEEVETKTEEKSFVVSDNNNIDDNASRPVMETTEETIEESEDELPSEVEGEEEEAPRIEPVRKVTKVAKVVKSAKFDPMSLVDIFPHIAEMREEDRSLITGYNEESGELEFADGYEEAICPEDNHTILDIFESCPYCGSSFI